MGIKIIDTNRKARHEYDIEDTLEAGLQLKGTEVKSLREGKASIEQAYCSVDRDGEMIMHGSYIKPYQQAGPYNNHEPRRNRKLLMHEREIHKWGDAAEQEGYTIVPLKLYFRRGWAKVQIGLGKGRKLHDKRQVMKEREEKRRLDEAKKRYNA